MNGPQFQAAVLPGYHHLNKWPALFSTATRLVFWHGYIQEACAPTPECASLSGRFSFFFTSLCLFYGYFVLWAGAPMMVQVAFQLY